MVTYNFFKVAMIDFHVWKQVLATLAQPEAYLLNGKI